MTASRCHFDVENRDFLDLVSSRITNEIAGVTRVLYDGKQSIPTFLSQLLMIVCKSHRSHRGFDLQILGLPLC